MTARTLLAPSDRETAVPSAWRRLSGRLRVLYVASNHRTGAWLAEAFASDPAAEVVLEEAAGATAALTRMRDEVFDALLVSHEPGKVEALDLVEALRTGGNDEPLIVLGTASEQELAPLCFEAGADAYVCVHTTTTRTLYWHLARGLERTHLLRDNRRLSEGERHRLELEHQETQRLLVEQRTLLKDLEALAGVESDHLAPTDAPLRPAAGAATPLPPRLLQHYRELLRHYVIMGSGNLATEMGALAELLAAAGFTAPRTMELHLAVVEEMVHGLGSRSARHVLTRADLLIVEILIQLAECYRRRYREQQSPLRQRLLPGFEGLVALAAAGDSPDDA